MEHHLLVDIDANYQIIEIRSVQSLTFSPTARLYGVVVQLDDLQHVFRKKGKLGTDWTNDVVIVIVKSVHVVVRISLVVVAYSAVACNRHVGMHLQR